MADNKKEGMSFLEHLEELRWVIIRSLVAMIIGAIFTYAFSHYIFDYVILAPRMPDFPTNRFLCHMGKVIHNFAIHCMMHPQNWFVYHIGHMLQFTSTCINQKPFQLININMAGQLNTDLFVSMIVGFILTFPYVFYQFWSFIAPALHEKERRYARGAVFYSSALFLIGILFGFFIILPFSTHFLGTYKVSKQVVNQININSYISNVSSVVLAAGLIFELPILVYFLSRIGVMTPKFMRKYRRHAIVVILIIAAIITPPDVFSQIMVTIPLLILYEISIFISSSVVKKLAK